MTWKRGYFRQALIDQGIITESFGLKLSGTDALLLGTGILGLKLLLSGSKSSDTPGVAVMQQPSFPLRQVVGGTATLGAATVGVVKLIDYLDTPSAAVTASPLPSPQEDLLSFFMRKYGAPSSTVIDAPKIDATKPTWTPPVDSRWLSLAPHPSVILILGKRGSGKSALGYRVLELFRNQADPYVVGIPQAARKLLPDWIGCVDRLEEVPPKAVVLVDESYIQFHARGSMSEAGRSIGQIVNLSRQRQQTLIFIVQEGRQLDVNAISQADVIAVKELAEISKEFERRELKRFTDKARVAFAGVPRNRKRQTWVYSETAGEVGLVENELASFWKPALSTAFAKVATEGDTNQVQDRKGTRTPRDELKAKVKALKLQQGLSFGVIGETLGISKTFAWELFNEPD